MNKITTLVIAATLLYSCSAEEAQDDNIATDVPMEINADTSDVQTTDVKPEEKLDEVVDDVFDYSKIEHYAIFDTKTKLVENFGTDNIVDGSTWYGEGSLELQHSVLTNPNNGHEIKYVWEEDNAELLAMIEISSDRRDKDYLSIGKQAVSSDCGVYTGMPLAALKEWNGADIEFSGFGWDFGGGVFRKEGSKVSTCKISFILGLNTNEDYEKYSQYLGDTSLSTSNEGILEAPISVAQITWFNDTAD
jgi:hypothetical protein